MRRPRPAVTPVRADGLPDLLRPRRAPGPRSWSPLGSTRPFRRDLLGTLDAGARTHGDLVRYRLGPVPVHAVCSPELAERVLTDSAVFGKLGPDNPLRLVLGDGLLTSSDHDSWLRNRRRMQPVFHRTGMEQLYASMLGCTRRWVDHFDSEYRPGDPVDLHAELMRVTLDVVSQAMFSADVLGDLDALGPKAVDTAVSYAFRRLQNPLSLPRTWPTPANRRFASVMSALDDVVYGLVDARRREGPRGDLLDMLLGARDDSGQAMSDRELRDEILTMFAAGHETTAITLTWTWWLLSQHRDVRERLQAEVDAVLPHGALPTLADLRRLPYTLQVFEEAMRLYPSAPIVPRLTLSDTVLGGCSLPAGSRVLVDLSVIHRHPRHWPEPDRFDPERFAEGRRKGSHRLSYLPFGAGPHLCIGKHFALLEAQLLLAAIAARWEFVHVPGHRVEPQASITLRPRDGMLMTVQPRPAYRRDRAERQAAA